MSQRADPIKRLLLWLSGAPAEGELSPSSAPRPAAAQTPPDDSANLENPAMNSSTATDSPAPPSRPPSGTPPLERYLLFGSPAASRTAVYLDLTRSYLMASQPAFGYSAGEAIHAGAVIIVGELQDVSQETEDALRQAGCQVQRVQGTPEQIVAALQNL